MTDNTPVSDESDELLTPDASPEAAAGDAEERLPSAPSPWLVLALFALIMFLNYHISAWAQHQNQLLGLLLTEWGLILMPVLGALWYTGADLRKTLRLRGFSPMQGVGAAVLALSMYVLIVGFCTLQALVLPDSGSQHAKEVFTRLFQWGGSWPGLLVLLFVMALSPAVCEEALFRGALLSGFRHCTRPVFAVSAVAVLFGVFHGSIQSFAPTAILGLVYTLVVWRTDSLWIGSIMHFVNNGTSALLNTGRLPRICTEWIMSIMFTTNGVLAGVLSLSIALAGIILGVVLIEAGRRGGKRNAANPAL